MILSLGSAGGIRRRFAVVSAFFVACMMPASVLAASTPIPDIANACQTTAPTVFLVDPFLVGALDNNHNLKNLDLAGLYQKRNWGTVKAAALEADNTSAAIAIVQTGPCAADVTLSTNNGTTLLPYDPAFLTKAPGTGGGKSLTIPAKNLTRVGTKYYAAALVQAPAVGATYNVSYLITVKAVQGSASQPVTMKLEVPPVILVHGLWGDASSLKDLKTYLLATPQWQKTGLVHAICYSQYLAFDAAKDPLSNGGDACEVTSTTALNQEIAHLVTILDTRHVVGGRIDVVAHSMGGLVVRYYSAQEQYRSPRNRNQGVFHEIVTIDTPEYGSALATFLYYHASAKRHASFGSGPYNLWEAECDSGDTVKTCFNKLGMPLASPSLALDSGAVYSLIPGGASIRAAPDARIPGATWRAVTAIWPQTDSRSSLLRSVMNTLIRAIYYDNQTAPDTSSILGTLDNDVVVKKTSQHGDAQGSYNFRDLAHTKTPHPSVFSAFFDGGNQNVEESSSVNRLIGCWLANLGSMTCSRVPKAAGENEAPLVASTAPVARFAASDRLAVDAPGRGPQFGVPFDLPLHFSSPVSRTVFVSQSDAHGEIPSGSGKATMTPQSGATSSVRITPQRFGPMTFTIAASFTDGGVAVKRFTATVRPPPCAADGLHGGAQPGCGRARQRGAGCDASARGDLS